jgi:hypothetical protein
MVTGTLLGTLAISPGGRGLGVYEDTMPGDFSIF